jgi:hypothetical protein
VSAFDRVLEGIKQVLLVSEGIKRLSEGVKELAAEVREIDRRVARIEGMVEVAKAQSGSRRRLPKSESRD